jgi:hypothetical protein
MKYEKQSAGSSAPPADRGVSASPKLAPPLQRVREGRKARPAFKFIKPLPRDLAVLEDPFLVDCFRHWGKKNTWRGLRNELDAAIFECMSTCVSRLRSEILSIFILRKPHLGRSLSPKRGA